MAKTPSKESESNGKANEGGGGLPLFFNKPQLIDKERHAEAGVKPEQHYGFTTSSNSVPLNAIEFLEAVKYFPIVFTNDETPTPVALIGLEQQNYFVDENGQWSTGVYVPAYLRQYPFVFYENKEEEKFFLCIDEDAPVFEEKAKKNSLRLFEKDGKPSATTNNALEFCRTFYGHHQITQNFCKDMKEHDLFESYNSQIKLESGKELNLRGFRMINEKKFNELPDSVILDFRKKGWLGFIYLALASAGNWKALVDRAAKQEDKKAA